MYVKRMAVRHRNGLAPKREGGREQRTQRERETITTSSAEVSSGAAAGASARPAEATSDAKAVVSAATTARA